MALSQTQDLSKNHYIYKVNSNRSSSWYIIANPAAGNHAVARQWLKLLAELKEQGFSFESAKTQHRGHAIDLVHLAIQKGFRKIIAVGGDGTNNEVINGIFTQTIVASKDITYCLYPIGTGNDWIKEHQIPKERKDWIAMLKSGQSYTQDIGLVSYHNNGKQAQRYFANVAGMSYDPYVLSEIEKRKRPINNRLIYLLFGLYYVFKYKLPKARVYFNDQVVEDYFYLINSGICRFSGGGMQFVPHAIPNDGKMALTLAGKLSKFAVLLNSYRFYNGKIAAHSKVNTFQTDHIKVEAINEPILVEVDGELLGETPVEFKIIPKALKIIVPT